MKPFHGDFASKSVSFTSSSQPSDSRRLKQMSIFGPIDSLYPIKYLNNLEQKLLDILLRNRANVKAQQLSDRINLTRLKSLRFNTCRHEGNKCHDAQKRNALLSNLINKESLENKQGQCTSSSSYSSKFFLSKKTVGVHRHRQSHSESRSTSIHSERKKCKIVRGFEKHKIRKADQIRSDPCSCTLKSTRISIFKKSAEGLVSALEYIRNIRDERKKPDNTYKVMKLFETPHNSKIKLSDKKSSIAYSPTTRYCKRTEARTIMNIVKETINAGLSPSRTHSLRRRPFKTSSFYAMYLQVRHNQKKITKLEPYEYEPGVCMPGECYPLDCHEHFVRRMNNSSTNTSSNKNIFMSNYTSQLHPDSELKNQEFRHHFKNPSTAVYSYINYKPNQTLPKNNKQAVRLGSSFSFNVEFSKDRSGTIDSSKISGTINNIRRRKGSVSSTGTTWDEKTYKTKGIRGYKNKNQDAESQSSTGVHHRGSMVRPKNGKCFCTFKLQKKGIQTKGINFKMKEPPGNFITLTNRSQNTKKIRTHKRKLHRHECEPNTCVPGECNPYECIERIKHRNNRSKGKDFGTGVAPRSNTATSSISFNNLTKGQYVQHNQIEGQAGQVIRPEPIDKPPRQAVRIQSSFSIDVEFFKDKSIGGENKMSLALTHNSESQKKSNTFKSSERPVQNSIDYRNQNDQAKAANKHESNKTDSFLKRCFCTAKLFNIQHIKRFGAKEISPERGRRRSSIKTTVTQNFHKFRKSLRDSPTSNVKYVDTHIQTDIPRERHRQPGYYTLRLKPYECERGFCVPGQCDPYVCAKRINKRSAIMSKSSSTDGPSTKTMSIGFNSSKISKSTSSSKRLPRLRNKQEKIRQKAKEKHFAKSVPTRNAVKIGSHFSFSTEFYKVTTSKADSFAANDNDEITERPHLKLKSRDTEGIKLKTKARGLRKTVSLVSRESQAHVVKQINRGSRMRPILKRCFCTLALHKGNASEQTKDPLEVNNIVSLGTESPYYKTIPQVRDGYSKARKYKPSKLKSYEREPGVCIPIQCDPYECDKLIRRRLLRESGMSTNRPSKLKSYECEPLVCTPGQCNPYECQKLIKRRLRRDSGMLTNRYRVRSSNTIGNRRKLKNRNIQSKQIRYKPLKRKDRNEGHFLRHKQIDCDKEGCNDDRQAVRIGSNFSFSIEFYKSASPSHANGTHNLIQEPKLKRNTSRISSQVNNMGRQLRRISSGTDSRVKNIGRPSQFDPRIMKAKGSQVLERCFCTLKLQKIGKTQYNKFTPDKFLRHSSAATKTKYDPALYYKDAKSKSRKVPLDPSHREYGTITPRYKIKPRLERYECERGTCVPGFCNPKECYERIQRRYLRTSGIGTDRTPTNSFTAITREPRTEMKKIQSEIDEVVVPKTQQPTKLIRQHTNLRQAVKIGSNFNFGIEFYKEKEAPFNKIVPDSFSKANRNDKKICASDSIDSVAKYINTNNSMTDSEIQARQATTNKGSATGKALKRCFCTAKLHQAGMAYARQRAITVGRIDIIKVMTPFKSLYKQCSSQTKVTAITPETGTVKDTIKNNEKLLGVTHQHYRVLQTFPYLEERRNVRTRYKRNSFSKPFANEVESQMGTRNQNDYTEEEKKPFTLTKTIFTMYPVNATTISMKVRDGYRKIRQQNKYIAAAGDTKGKEVVKKKPNNNVLTTNDKSVETCPNYNFMKSKIMTKNKSWSEYKPDVEFKVNATKQLNINDFNMKQKPSCNNVCDRVNNDIARLRLMKNESTKTSEKFLQLMTSYQNKRTTQKSLYNKEKNKLVRLEKLQSFLQCTGNKMKRHVKTEKPKKYTKAQNISATYDRNIGKVTTIIFVEGTDVSCKASIENGDNVAPVDIIGTSDGDLDTKSKITLKNKQIVKQVFTKRIPCSKIFSDHIVKHGSNNIYRLRLMKNESTKTYEKYLLESGTFYQNTSHHENKRNNAPRKRKHFTFMSFHNNRIRRQIKSVIQNKYTEVHTISGNDLAKNISSRYELGNSTAMVFIGGTDIDCKIVQEHQDSAAAGDTNKLQNKEDKKSTYNHTTLMNRGVTKTNSSSEDEPLLKSNVILKKKQNKLICSKRKPCYNNFSDRSEKHSSYKTSVLSLMKTKTTNTKQKFSGRSLYHKNNRKLQANVRTFCMNAIYKQIETGSLKQHTKRERNLKELPKNMDARYGTNSTVLLDDSSDVYSKSSQTHKNNAAAGDTKPITMKRNVNVQTKHKCAETCPYYVYVKKKYLKKNVKHRGTKIKDELETSIIYRNDWKLQSSPHNKAKKYITPRKKPSNRFYGIKIEILKKPKRCTEVEIITKTKSLKCPENNAIDLLEGDSEDKDSAAAGDSKRQEIIKNKQSSIMQNDKKCAERCPPSSLIKNKGIAKMGTVATVCGSETNLRISQEKEATDERTMSKTIKNEIWRMSSGLNEKSVDVNQTFTVDLTTVKKQVNQETKTIYKQHSKCQIQYVMDFFRRLFKPMIKMRKTVEIPSELKNGNKYRIPENKKRKNLSNNDNDNIFKNVEKQSAIIHNYTKVQGSHEKYIIKKTRHDVNAFMLRLTKSKYLLNRNFKVQSPQNRQYFAKISNEVKTLLPFLSRYKKSISKNSNIQSSQNNQYFKRTVGEIEETLMPHSPKNIKLPTKSSKCQNPQNKQYSKTTENVVEYVVPHPPKTNKLFSINIADLLAEAESSKKVETSEAQPCEIFRNSDRNRLMLMNESKHLWPCEKQNKIYQKKTLILSTKVNNIFGMNKSLLPIRSSDLRKRSINTFPSHLDYDTMNQTGNSIANAHKTNFESDKPEEDVKWKCFGCFKKKLPNVTPVGNIEVKVNGRYLNKHKFRSKDKKNTVVSLSGNYVDCEINTKVDEENRCNATCSYYNDITKSKLKDTIAIIEAQNHNKLKSIDNLEMKTKSSKKSLPHLPILGKRCFPQLTVLSNVKRAKPRTTKKSKGEIKKILVKKRNKEKELKQLRKKYTLEDKIVLKQRKRRIELQKRAKACVQAANNKAESCIVTNFILNAADKDPKKRMTLTKNKKQIPNRKRVEDWDCSLYMCSLRNKPLIALYRMCPKFYPHWISFLKHVRQVTDVMLFLLAVVVWRPCIFVIKVCRAFVRCYICQG